MLLPTLTLPIRIVFYTCLMLPFSFLFLVLTFFRALYRRCMHGSATEINSAANHITTSSQGYACQIVLTQPIVDHDLFQTIVTDLAKECHIDPDYVKIIFEQDRPHGELPTEEALPADHYVAKGECFVETADVTGAHLAKNTALFIRVWNNAPKKPTVLHCGLPGANWDGTSCFNFTKEMLYRYANPTLKKNSIYQLGQLQLNSKVKASLDQSPFLTFLTYVLYQQPYGVVFNTHCMCWRLATVFGCFGGPGIHPHVVLLNLTQQTSMELTKAAKKLKIKPFAVLSHAVVTAHNEIMGKFHINNICLLWTVVEKLTSFFPFLLYFFHRHPSPSCGDPSLHANARVRTNYFRKKHYW